MIPKRNGMGLIELILVLAILGVLLSVSLPRFSGLTGEAARTADERSAVLLTRATRELAAARQTTPADLLADISEDQERLAFLRDEGAIARIPEPQDPSHSFAWEAPEERWTTGGGFTAWPPQEQLDFLASEILGSGVLSGVDRTASFLAAGSWASALHGVLADPQGRNNYGLENPLSRTGPYEGQAVLRAVTLNVDESLWNPSVFITNHPVYGSHGFSPNHIYYDRLRGSMVFYRDREADPSDNRIYYHYIHPDGQKSPLQFLEIPD